MKHTPVIARVSFMLPFILIAALAQPAPGPSPSPSPGPGPGPGGGGGGGDEEQVGGSGFNYIDLLDIFDNGHIIPPAVMEGFSDDEIPEIERPAERPEQTSAATGQTTGTAIQQQYGPQAAPGEGETIDKTLWGLKYSRFDIFRDSGNAWGLTLGWERETEKWKYGIVVPYDWLDFDGTADDGFGVTLSPYLHYIPLRDPVTISIGPYGIYNYMYFEGPGDDASIKGAGVSGALDLALSAKYWARLSTAVEYLDANIRAEVDSAWRLRYGASTGGWITEKLGGRIFYAGILADDNFFDSDKSFGFVGGEVSFAVTPGFALSLGYATDLGFDNVESHTCYFGGAIGGY